MSFVVLEIYVATCYKNELFLKLIAAPFICQYFVWNECLLVIEIIQIKMKILSVLWCLLSILMTFAGKVWT